MIQSTPQNLQHIKVREQKSILTIWLMPVILITCLVTSCASLNNRTISVSESDLQNKIAKKFQAPITLLKIFNVALSNPIVKLDEKTGRVNTSIDASVTNPLSKTPLAGSLSISGVPRFDVATNTLMLSQAKLENFNFNGTDSKFGQIIQLITQSFGDQLLNEIPLYTVKPEDLKMGNTTFIPADFKIVGSSLQVMLKAK